MISTSYLAIALGSIVLFGLGWFLNQFIVTNKAKDYKIKFLELEKEQKHQSKKLKKELKQVEQLKQKAESWKHEFHALTKETQELRKNHQMSIGEQSVLTDQVKTEAASLRLERDQFQTNNNRLQKEVANLKEKYKRDVASGTEWRSERKEMERQVKDLTSKLGKTTLSYNEYKGKYDSQALEISKIRTIEREGRQLKTKLSKAEKECEYWEKKHYDVHHELAQLKVSVDKMNTDYAELVNLRKGDEILKSNLMEQISEFKTKFLNVNNKYRELVSK